MKKIIIVLGILSSLLSYAKPYKEINSLKIKVSEKLYLSGKVRDKEYSVKIQLPDVTLKEMEKPNINRGEKYLYKDNKKIVYYPLLDDRIEKEDVDEWKGILTVINEIKYFETLELIEGENRVDNVLVYMEKDSTYSKIEYIDDKITINLKEYQDVGGFMLPFEIEVLEGGVLVSSIKLYEYDVNLEFATGELTI